MTIDEIVRVEFGYPDLRENDCPYCEMQDSAHEENCSYFDRPDLDS